MAANNNNTTLEDALNTIVDTFSNVILLFEEAELNPTSRINVSSTEQIDTALNFLFQVAQSVGQNLNEKLKPQMNQILESMKRSQEALQPFKSKTLKREDYKVINNEMKSLLSGAVGTIKLQDQQRVKNIMDMGIQAVDAIKRLKMVTTQQQLLSVAQELSNYSVTLTSLLQRRMDNLSSSNYVSVLRESIDTMKNATPDAIRISAEALANGMNSRILQTRDQVFMRLGTGIANGIKVVQQSADYLNNFDLDSIEINRPMRAEKRSLEGIAVLRKEIANTINEMQNAFRTGDYQKMLAAEKRFAEQIRNQAALAREVAERIDDPQQKAALLRIADQMEELIPQIAALNQALIKDPNNKELLAQRDKLLEQAKLLSMQTELAAKNGALQSEIMNALDAMYRGDMEAFKDSAQRVNQNLTDQIAMARELASKTSNPEQKKGLLEAAAKLESLQRQLNAAVDAVVKDPKNLEKQRAVEKIFGEIAEWSNKLTTEALKPLETTIVPNASFLPEKASALSKRILQEGALASEAMDRVMRAARLGDKELTARYVNETVEHLRNQIAGGRQILSQIKDPKLRQELSDALDRLEKLIPEIEAAAKYAAEHPNDPAAQKRLQDLMEKARKEMLTIAGCIKKHEEQREKEEREKPKIDTTKTEFNTAVPKDLGNAMASVNNAASGSIFGENTPQGRLVKNSKLMVDIIERMAIAADAKDLKGVINAAKDLWPIILEIQKQAKIVADECGDAKLREQLLNSAGVPRNFAMQLKIIATMKAAQGLETKDRVQLFGLSKKVCSSVEQVITNSEIAALAKKK